MRTSNSRALGCTDAQVLEFQKCLDAWIELDNILRRLQEMVREKRKLKEEMQTRITAFMSKYDVEDVDRKETSLRYRVVKSKKAPTKADIRARLLDHYQGDSEAADGLARKLLESRAVVERPTLRRVRVAPA
jgi:hypothetical protein